METIQAELRKSMHYLSMKKRDHAADKIDALQAQVEALTAQLDSYAMALNETKAERDNLINLLENSWQGWFPAVHDGAGFDRHEFVFKSSERDLRIAIKGTA